MKRVSKKFIIPAIILLLFFTILTTALAANPVISVKNGEVISKDLFTAGETVTNEGTIKGDFIVTASEVNSKGIIEGDYLSAARDIYMSGKVLGDMRSGAATITVSGEVQKNINCFAKTVNIKEGSVIGGNLLTAAQDVNIAGAVKGHSTIYGQNIILNGEFFGDVDINLDEEDMYMSRNVSITVLPGTKIHGKLSYRGVTEAQISPEAEIKDKNWIEAKERLNDKEEKSPNYFVRFIKMIFTMAVYFFIGLLLYKLFPAAFKRQGEVIDEKPWSILGFGAAALFSPIAFLIAFGLLIFLSIWVISPSILFIFGGAITGFYMLLFYLSTIPVALWLGNRLFQDRYRLTYRFGLGLTIITIGMFCLKLLSVIPSASGLFGIISFILGFVILIFGTGALLFGIGNIYSSIKEGQKIQIL